MNQFTSNSLQDLTSLAHAYLPVFHGDVPEGIVSLRALADEDVLARLVPLMASSISSDDRQAGITVIHYAVGVATEVLLSSLALDGVTIEATADQLGIVIGENGALNAFWIAQNISINRNRLVAQMGNQVSAILKPIVAAVQTRNNLSRRGLDLVLYDAIWRGCRRLENASSVKVERGWVDQILITMGDSRNKRPRTFTVQADDGEPVEMVIPRVCCVLARNSTPHACPTCPQHSDTDRGEYTEVWLRSLDADGFRSETGRGRVSFNGSG